MTHRFVKAGQVVIRKGGKILEPGAVVGEIGIFARDQKRTATVLCVSDCELYELSESKAKQLYFQDRSFGLAVLQLIIARLLENMTLFQTGPIGNRCEEVPERAPQVHLPLQGPLLAPGTRFNRTAASEAK